MKKKKNLFNNFISRNFSIFIVLFLIILIAYHKVFNSYFESDEWFYFTYYLPLTKKPLGFLTAISAMFTQSGYLSGGQHVIPVASFIQFLNTKFFGLNFFPYAFLSLFFHGINSFLVFVFIKMLLRKKLSLEKNMSALLGSLFFALSPVPMHAITGFAAFYGQIALSVTFFLLGIISFEQSYLTKNRKFLLLTILFLFLAVLTQESAVILFVILPIMTVFKKKIFSYKFLSVLFLSCVFVYISMRFFVPNIYSVLERMATMSLPSSYTESITANEQKIIIDQKLLNEILFRIVTYPVRMIGAIFIPQETLFFYHTFSGAYHLPVSSGGR